MRASEIRGVDKMRGRENGVNEAAVERAINGTRLDGSLALGHPGANAREVETEIESGHYSEPEQNLFGASSHDACSGN